MDFFENVNNLKMLQNLLNPTENQSDSEEEEAGETDAKYTTCLAKNVTFEPIKKNAYQPASDVHQNRLKEPKTMDEWEQQQKTKNDEELDGRERPDYTIKYKQSVNTEDVFLQMANKTSATSSCEDICIEIKLPDETIGIDQMELEVRSDSFELKTSKYRLKMPLMQPINPDNGRAIWDNQRKLLTLTMKMKRELDFVNF